MPGKAYTCADDGPGAQQHQATDFELIILFDSFKTKQDIQNKCLTDGSLDGNPLHLQRFLQLQRELPAVPGVPQLGVVGDGGAYRPL